MCPVPHCLSQHQAARGHQTLHSRRQDGGRARASVPTCSSSKNRALGRAEALGRREGRPAKLAADRISDAAAAARRPAAQRQGCPVRGWPGWPPKLVRVASTWEAWGMERTSPLGAGIAPHSAQKRQKDQWQRWGWILAREQLPRRPGPEAAPPTSSQCPGSANAGNCLTDPTMRASSPGWTTTSELGCMAVLLGSSS